MLDSVNEVSLAAEDRGAVVERPPEEMFGVFAQEGHRRGLLSDGDLRLFEQTLDASYRIARKPDLLVVLHGDPRLLHKKGPARGEGGGPPLFFFFIVAGGVWC